tara:strand:+ start:2537 stop:2941 length:405 start_codon:yes stop_codon:yes gene_type:complete
MIQLDQRVIGFINVFERTTRASVKDCFEEGDVLVFVVQPGQIRKAVGKGGENIKRVSYLTKKKIKVIEFSDSPAKFVSNLLYPMKAEIELRDNVLVIKSKDNKEKGRIFGREKSNLKRIQKMADKYFKIEVAVE